MKRRLLLPRGPLRTVPRLTGTMKRSDSLPHVAPHVVSSLGDTIVSSLDRPHRLGTGAVNQPGVGKPGAV